MGLPMMAARADVHSAENQARIRQVANGAPKQGAAGHHGDSRGDDPGRLPKMPLDGEVRRRDRLGHRPAARRASRHARRQPCPRGVEHGAPAASRVQGQAHRQDHRMGIVELLGNKPLRARTATSYAVKAKFNETDPPLIIVRKSTSGSAPTDCPAAVTRSPRSSLTAPAAPPPRPCQWTGQRSTCPHSASSPCPAAATPSTTTSGTFHSAEDELKPPGVTMPRNSLDPDTESEAAMLRAALHVYMRSLLPVITRLQRKFRPPHPMFNDRLDQICAPPT